MTTGKECVRTFGFVLLTIMGIVSAAEPQAAPQGQEANQSAAAPLQSQGAVSSGGAHAAVLDNEKRPITAGGFVDSGPIVFQEVAEKAGLTRWRHLMGSEDL